MTPATDPVLTPLNPQQNLRQSVMERLRTAIVTGELAEGTVVSAPALGAQLGVSATPVREAMMDLTREGMVATVKNKGFRVTALSDEELAQITEVRLLVEPPAVRSVAGHVPAADLARLRALADENIAAARAGDLRTYLGTDVQLHSLLLAHAGNPLLQQLATDLRRRTRLYGLRGLAAAGTLADSAAEHHELIDLVEAGDGAGAEELIRRHIGHANGLWQTGDGHDEG